MSYILSYNDFLQRTKDKIEALQILCKAYDDGKYSIAKEIAASIRVLVHDTHSSTSLLAHLGLKDSIRMLSTKEPAAHNELVLIGDGLYAMQMGNSQLIYIPKLGNSAIQYCSFGVWWNEKVLHDMNDGFTENTWRTRKELVLAYSNKEGGAHVDASLPDDVFKQSSPAVSGFVFTTFGPTTGEMMKPPSNTPKDATIRQIAYEIQRSLYEELPELFEDTAV